MNSSTTISESHASGGARLLRAADELRTALAGARAEGQTIGLVPTMGSLHEGHLSLLRAARGECGVVVMSLFVNPAQFGPGEDLDRYPRDEARDVGLAAEAGVELIYAPVAGDIYPEGFATSVTVEGLTEILDGDPALRGPQHFRGVTTIVAKLFNTVQPDVAYFGQKDAQQLAVIRRMVRDLDIPVRIEALPTVREPDGLAMSSRNAYLSEAERRCATALPLALREAASRARRETLAAGIEAGRAKLAAAGIEAEYFEARDPDDLTAVSELNGKPVLIVLAAQIGRARLIDNVLVHPDPRA